ncbi:MAG: chemotaxis protein CheA [bacterium]|nr:chemotaxis protein CheA [bacterium]
MSSDEYNETTELILTFTNEGQEMLDEVEPYFVTMQESAESGESVDPEILNAIFRLFHTMKGSAGFLELYNMQSVTHEAETLLDLYRKGDKEPQPEDINVLLTSCDFIRTLLDNINQNMNDKGFESETEDLVNKLITISKGTPPAQSSKEAEVVSEEAAAEEESDSEVEAEDSFEIVITPEMTQQFISEATEILDTLEQDLIEIENNPENSDVIGTAFRKLHTFKGNCGLLGYGDLEQLSHRLETMLDLMRSGKITNIKSNIKIVLNVLDILQEGVDSLIKGGSGDVPKTDIMLELLNDVIKEVDPEFKPESPKTKKAVTKKPEETPEKSTEKKTDVKEEVKTKPAQKAKETKQPPKAAAMVKKDIRVDLDKVDKLVDLVGEISLAENMVVQNPDLNGIKMQNFERAAHHLNGLVSELQYVSMSLRMIPIAGTFRKMIRLVHDLSYKSGKKVTLETRGEDTEVDKTVVEQIADPLVHIVRNSIDHGIEPPEERLELGKVENSVLLIEAKHEGGEVWISIVDDGRGLNKDRILEKAKSQGLIDGDGEGLSDEEIFKYIFEPGFSTAKKITEVSGRGVGMDVVKRNIEKLKGNIDVKSEKGQGTTITLRIPLTLALIDGMLVKVGDTRYIIPLLEIRESINPSESDITLTPDGREIVKVRNDLVPVVRLHKMYDIEPMNQELHKSILILLSHRGRSYCLAVDQVLGQQQAVIKGLSDYIGDVSGASGCTILGDGIVSLILDVGSLYEMSVLAN